MTPTLPANPVSPTCQLVQSRPLAGLTASTRPHSSRSTRPSPMPHRHSEVAPRSLSEIQSLGPPRPGMCACVHACARARAHSLWLEEHCPVLTPGMVPPQGLHTPSPTAKGSAPGQAGVRPAPRLAAVPQPPHTPVLPSPGHLWGQLHRQTRPPMRQRSTRPSALTPLSTKARHAQEVT